MLISSSEVFTAVPVAKEQADLATGRERQLTTGKRAERTKHDFRRSICSSAIGQASCLIDVPVLLLNQSNITVSTGNPSVLCEESTLMDYFVA